jgi:hypothetical protein
MMKIFKKIIIIKIKIKNNKFNIKSFNSKKNIFLAKIRLSFINALKVSNLMI